VRRIELETQVGGRLFRQSFAAQPNQRTTFTWDGMDAYGRPLQGIQPVVARIGYTYGAVYNTAPDRFGSAGGGAITGSTARQEVTLWRTWRGQIGSWDARAVGLGGWTLSAHHTLDQAAQALYRGDGGRQAVNAATVKTAAGTGTAQSGCFGGDGGRERLPLHLPRRALRRRRPGPPGPTGRPLRGRGWARRQLLRRRSR
jgi:hypothetical protein